MKTILCSAALAAAILAAFSGCGSTENPGAGTDSGSDSGDADAGGLVRRGNTDVISTPSGELRITFVGHGTLMFEYRGKVVHVDPVGREGDYKTMPDADLILVTHEHGDHLDPAAIEEIRKEGTVLVVAKPCEGLVEGAAVMKNGDRGTHAGFAIEAHPAYNVEHKRPSGEPFHPKGAGNGYVIAFGSTRVYVAGDTENIPEMELLDGIDIAFLPMNLPYTMTPEMVAAAARSFRPRVLYPYHFGETDTSMIVKLLESEKGIEVRIRDMK